MLSILLLFLLLALLISALLSSYNKTRGENEMSVNSLTFEQSAAFLMDMYKEATGKDATIQVVDTGTFTTVATTLLQMGYDPIISAITQVLDKSIYSIRPYSMKFRSINVDESKWGAVTRKINYLDSDLDAADQRLSLVDGQSIDQYKVKKPKVLQTNFYGATQYQDHITIFRDQLDSAMRDAGEFGRFMAGVMQNMADKLAQISEGESRGVLANFITGKYTVDSANCINVLQAYYDQTGTELSPDTMYNQDNYGPFIRWFYSFVNDLTDFMSERSYKYHVNLSGKEIPRHTPANMLRAYMSGTVVNKTASEVLATVFNPDKLKMIDFEKVTFWQNIEDPYTVKATPSYFDPSTGEVVDAEEAVTVSNLIGVLFDEEALGTTRRSTWTASSPFNAAGGYYNIFYHFTQTTWNDFTENGVILYAGEVVTS
jgi:hypothetical protein